MGDRKGTVVALAIAFIILPITAVVFRFWAKSITRMRLTADDYMIIPALVSYSPYDHDHESHSDDIPDIRPGHWSLSACW